ncbi:hypothetical protein [Desulfobacula phenolica]|uniref:Heparinase II/III-like protein n=1 Tax=Desulfobacula phenolica TaxID=90732 RepID=A0A1H2EQC0_9BACT|nr:hypothetical protein [Desulfobacula phenolica]SDT97143.1 hypothetical protein SAMN04487931_103278 [Desulfobacula phenolica]
MKKKFFIWVFLLIVSGIYLVSAEIRSKEFHTSYAREALPLHDLPDVLPEHPRLFMRPKPWSHGPSLQELRQQSEYGDLKAFVNRKPWNPKPGMEWAFRYLLTEDEHLAKSVIDSMKTSDFYWPGKLTELAVLYDWMYNCKLFTGSDKLVVENKILQWAEKAIQMGQERSTLWNHMGYSPFLDIAAAGLALAGHRREADRLMAMARGYAKNNLFPAWQANDGAWQGGWVYYAQGCAKLFEFVALWSGATQENLYKLIREEQGDWLKNHLYYLIYTMYPDRTPVDTSGFSATIGQKGGVFTLLLLARALKDPYAIEHVRWRNEKGWRLGIWQYLYALPENFPRGKKKNTLPLSKLWGRKGMGYVQMRSGWGENDTIVEFKCGDYFWSHQFQNQNSFTIYRNGRLAIQSGFYDSYFSRHMQFYYRPSISSNTILLVQPGETRWIPESVAYRFGIPNEKGYIKEWGGQRNCYIMPKYGSAESCFTWNKYVWRKNNQHHFETGDIKEFETTDQYTYVFGDATDAYNNNKFSALGNRPKMELSQRAMVFLDRKYLVVFDRIRSLDRGYKKKWLLHSIGEPVLENRPLKVETAGHREIYNAGSVRINHLEGSLVCKTLFGNDFLIEKIGGSARVSKIFPNSDNKGTALLKTSINDGYSRVSSTIATDKAVKETWHIEFLDSDRFKVRGSVTGPDGSGSVKKKYFLSNTESLFIPGQNWVGRPVKGDFFRLKILSSSHRFWVDGQNQSPGIKKMIQLFHDGTHVEPGNWRIEVYPKNQNEFDSFLHFLYPCDRKNNKFPDPVELVTDDNTMKGLFVDHWVLLFSNITEFVYRKITYPIQSNKQMSHLLTGMKPDKEFIVTIFMPDSRENKTIRSSGSGTLLFYTSKARKIEILPKY